MSVTTAILPPYTVARIDHPASAPEWPAVASMYKDFFTEDERYPESELASWAGISNDLMTTVAWAMKDDRNEVCGFTFWGYLPYHRFGYLLYLACRPAVRRDRLAWRGEAGERDRWLVEQVVTGVERRSRKQQQEPRLVFLEARNPFEKGISAAQCERRLALIRHWVLAGFWPLPVDYLCPPVKPNMPAVPYIVMVRVLPHNRLLTADEAREVCFAGLTEMNNGVRGDSHIGRALASIDTMWTKPLDAYQRAAQVLGVGDIVRLPAR